jgi:Protein of unknown function (DUF5131)
MIFVSLVSDLFRDAVRASYKDAVAKVMVAAKRHTYQVLTKRFERVRKVLNSKLSFPSKPAPIMAICGSCMKLTSERTYNTQPIQICTSCAASSW